MWKNPKIVLNAFCPLTVRVLIEGSFHLHPFPSPLPEMEGIVNRRDLKMYSRISKIYEELRLLFPCEPTLLEARYSRLLLELAKEIEESRQWQKVHNIFELVSDLNVQNGLYWHFVINSAYTIRWLVSSEQKHLIGTRLNQSAWIPYKLPKNPSTASFIELFPIDVDTRYLDGNDLDILPKANEWTISAKEPIVLQLPKDPWHSITQLLESAYYNQQYIPHPNGSHVRITGVPGIDSLIIKTKRSISDPTYLDFVGIFHYTSGGKDVAVLEGPESVNFSGKNIIRLGANSTRMKLYLIMAQVYHDLVTVKEDTIRRSLKPEKGTNIAQVSPEKSQLVNWIPIPRVLHRKPIEFRLPAKNPRSMRPHRVSGHKRKGNITDAHRSVLESFEKETGIEILRWLPEGYTFVRPHISPADGTETIQELPRFIRRRIQEDIKSLLTN